MVGKVWGERVEKKYATIAWGLGRDKVVKITDGMPLPGIPDDWSIVTVYVNTTTSIIGFRHTESSKHEHVEHE